MPLAPDDRLGAYKILSLLGAGGMGEVYRARDITLGREVALRILPEDFVRDPKRVERFRDSVQVLTEIAGGARGLYHLSGVIRFGPGSQIHLYGSEGTIKVEFAPHERLLGARRGDKSLAEIPVPPEQALDWRVEAEFIDAIRGGGKIEFTDFATGVRYMEFTEAVARSAEIGQAVDLPAS